MKSAKYLRLLGELLITGSVVVFLYLIYQVWYTNLESDQASTTISEELIRSFEKSEPLPEDSLALELSAEAVLYIPALDYDAFGVPILNGVSERQLASGVGKYPQSENVGQLGNYAIAGHRATYGEPFARFEVLQAGDMVYVQTKDAWYSYRLFANQKIQKTEVWVIADKPEQIEVPSERLITLTTCDPRWNSVRRWAWWGELISISDEAPREVLEMAVAR